MALLFVADYALMSFVLICFVASINSFFEYSSLTWYRSIRRNGQRYQPDLALCVFVVVVDSGGGLFILFFVNVFNNGDIEDITSSRQTNSVGNP